MTEHQQIAHTNFHESELDDIYYHCVFTGCDFSEKTITNTEFEHCEFRSCNFTLCKFKGALRTILFTDCKMVGANFSEIQRFSHELVFESSQLDYANFSATKLRKTVFRKCRMFESYLDDADLAYTLFDGCDLERASFHHTNLEKADFSTSFNFCINPNVCKLKKTIFSEDGLRGLVAHLNIEIK